MSNHHEQVGALVYYAKEAQMYLEKMATLYGEPMPEILSKNLLKALLPFKHVTDATGQNEPANELSTVKN